MIGGWRLLIAAGLLVLGGLGGGGTSAWLGPAPEDPTAATETPDRSGAPGASAASELGETAAEPAPPPAWQRFGVAIEPKDDHLRIAVIVTELGLDAQTTATAIDQLPAGITLSFSPHANKLGDWIARARDDGHEVMLDLPMEADAFASADPGPRALHSSLSPAENLERLRWIVERGEGYVGLATIQRTPIATLPEQMQPLLDELQALGLAYVHSSEQEDSVVAELARKLGLPHAMNLRDLDSDDASAAVIEARLAQLERLALTEGRALGMARPLPNTLAALSQWASELPVRGFQLVPVSAVVHTPAAQGGDTQSAVSQ